MTINLSPHFTLAEMSASDYALRNAMDNTPGVEEVACLRSLCNTILESIRQQVGGPIVVTSGYRSVAVNHSIGGSPTSQHMKGQAADFHIPGTGNSQVVKEIVYASTLIPFDQLILEGDEDRGGWIHVSYAPSGTERRQLLSADFSTGKAVYSLLTV